MNVRAPAFGILLIAGAALFARSAGADPQVILKEKGCLVCHDFDRRKVGPAYKDVAKRYKGQADAAEKLAAKVSGAKMGHPKTTATFAEAKEAIAYILSR